MTQQVIVHTPFATFAGVPVGDRVASADQEAASIATGRTMTAGVKVNACTCPFRYLCRLERARGASATSPRYDDDSGRPPVR